MPRLRVVPIPVSTAHEDIRPPENPSRPPHLRVVYITLTQSPRLRVAIFPSPPRSPPDTR